MHAALTALERAVLPSCAGDDPNFVEKQVDTSRFFDAPTWHRLRGVKAHYDPDDALRGNHRISPAERQAAARQAA